MSKTLLEITQGILSDTFGDVVNSITDTEDSEAVARSVIRVFDQMMSDRDWPHTKTLLKLNSPSDPNKPTHLSFAQEFKSLIMVNYNKQKLGDARLRYDEIYWKDPDDFLRLTNRRDSTSTTVQTVTDGTGVKLLIYNNRHPQYYTAFDDENIVMDSFDSSVDTTLHPDNIQAYAYITPTATFDNTWVPDLPESAFPLLEAEALALAHYNLTATVHQKAEDKASRLDSTLSRKARRVGEGPKKTPKNYRKTGRARTKHVTFTENKHG